MISCNISMFPSEGEYKECFLIKDKNEFLWKIATVDNGYFVAYFGDSYFMEKYFDIEINNETQLILNSGCFFIQSDEDINIEDFKGLIKDLWTDDIWDAISVYLIDRLKNNDNLIDCEVVKN